jgi:carbon-monoxide dehydrogenase medium subunit/xanthine dehydrogenase FAD-binding subunit
MLTCDSYLVPEALEEALLLLNEGGKACRIVAGCTDFLPLARQGRAGDVHVPTLIDVTHIAELRTHCLENGRVRLGAATAFERFLDDEELQRLLPMMPRCAVWFADDQIRESATLGGNIINASPAADSLPPMLAANAVVELARWQDGVIARRFLPITEFVTGPGQTAIAANEILVSITCDALPGYGGSFEKVGHRRSLVISLVCLCAAVKLDDLGRFADVRLAIGGVGPIPMRMTDIEQAVLGQSPKSHTIEAAAELGVHYVHSRSREEYRRSVIPGFVVQALLSAAERAAAHPVACAREEALHA